MSRDIIRLLGESSDAQLATPLAKECAEFAKGEHSDEETTRFLRDLRDICVHDAGASSFVMATLAALLPDPEPEHECKQRRVALRKRYGMEEPTERCPTCDDLLAAPSEGRVGCLRCDYSRTVGEEVEPPKETHFMKREDGLWEKVVYGQVVGLFRTVETRPPEWPGDDAVEEKKQEWKQEADRRMARAEAPGVEMFFAVGKGPIPEITFAEPVIEQEGHE